MADQAIRLGQVISENRFLAARDGINAELIDPEDEVRVPVADIVEDLLVACRPHAQDLGCEAELEEVRDLARSNGATKQLDLSRRLRTLQGVVASFAEHYAGAGAAIPERDSA